MRPAESESDGACRHTLGAVISHRQGKSHRRRWWLSAEHGLHLALARETAAAAPEHGGAEALDCSGSVLCVHPMGQDRLRQRGKHHQRSGATHASDRVGGRLSSWAATLRSYSGPSQAQQALQARSPCSRSFRTTCWWVLACRFRSLLLEQVDGVTPARGRTSNRALSAELPFIRNIPVRACIDSSRTYAWRPLPR